MSARIPVSRFCVLVLALITATPLAAADWPQWRGPDRNGRSAETGLLASWPEGGPPLAWKTAGLGAGYSSLAVADGRIFTLGDFEDGEYVLALKKDGGELLWKTRIGSAHEADSYSGSRSTPTVAGDRIYVLGSDGTVAALEVATGKTLWTRSLPGDFDGYLMKAMGSYHWAWSESPLVDGDKVVVTPGHVGALLVALDKSTGEEIWRTRGRRLGPLGADGAAYSSIAISEATGRRQYVQLLGRGLVGVDAATGELLWNYNRVASDIANITTPIVSGDHVFGTVGYGTGSALLKIGPPAEGEEGLHAEEVWFLEADTLQNHHGGVILHEGVLYTGTGHNKGFPIAVDFLSGEVKWGPIRNEGRDSAAIVFADGRLYLRYQNGLMVLVEATPEEYREHGSFEIPPPIVHSWSHPVISDGVLYLREQDGLFAYDVRAAEAQAGR